jgi:hypothetical protein
MYPVPYPARRHFWLLIILPMASSIRQISRNAKSKTKTQELLIAAIVNITVRINQTQRYKATDCWNSEVSWPVSLSV